MDAQPVDVICICSADGQIRPLRLQLKDEEHQLLRINIEKIISSRIVSHTGVEAQIFLCRGTLWDRSLTFELKYGIRTHSWSILGSLR